MTTAVDPTTATLHGERAFDPDALRNRYRAERDKRLRADGNEQYIEVKGAFAHYLDDPYVEPGFSREPLSDEVEVADRNKLPSVDFEVYFVSGSARITPRAAATLNPLGRALSDKRLAHGTFLIAGHTDAKGSAEYNHELSRRRAEAVREYLIEHFAIDPKRLVSRGYGFDRLKFPGRPMAPENRRVQIVNWTSQVPR